MPTPPSSPPPSSSPQPSGTPPTSSADTPSLVAAHALLEHLQTTGHRDRLKEWLLRQLATSGWVSELNVEMQRIARVHGEEHEGEPLPARELAKRLAPMATESVPEGVKVGLMRELVKMAREFQAEYAVSVANGPVHDEEEGTPAAAPDRE